VVGYKHGTMATDIQCTAPNTLFLQAMGPWGPTEAGPALGSGSLSYRVSIGVGIHPWLLCPEGCICQSVGPVTRFFKVPGAVQVLSKGLCLVLRV
jgi:hypothetical protein